MGENRKIVPGLAGTKKYPAGGILKSRFNPARRLRHLNNQPPKHPCFSISRPPSPSQVDIVCPRADIVWCFVRMR